MIFDAFSMELDMIPDSIKKQYRCQDNCIIIFADSLPSIDNITLIDGVLRVGGSEFSYISMRGKTLRDFTPCQIIMHEITHRQWKALTNGFKSTYRSFIDHQEVIDQLKGLPFSSEKAMIDFFIEEIMFSPNDGVMPIGIAIMDTALQSLIPLCKVNARHDWA